MEKLFSNIFLLTNLILLLTVGLAIILGLYYFNLKEEISTENFYCGTISIEQQILNSNIKLNKRGKRLFEENCLTCHSATDEVVVGPGLKDITKRRKKKWIQSFIWDSQKLIKSGDRHAKSLYKQYNYSIMTRFPELSKADIDSILNFIEQRNRIVY